MSDLEKITLNNIKYIREDLIIQCTPNELKEKLAKAMEKLIQSKDVSYQEQEIWALEEALDLIQGILP